MARAFDRNAPEQPTAAALLLMTDKRRVILDILDEADDHPTAEEILERAVRRDRRLSLATVYRNLGVLTRAGLLTRLEFGEGRSRYERRRPQPHDHLVEMDSGKVVEFSEPAIEALLRAAAATLGYDLIDYRLDIFARPRSGPAE